MTQYLIRRILIMIPTLIGILVVSFAVIKLAPGDPGSLKHGGVGQTTAGMNAERGTEDALKRFRDKYGFNRPIHVQFGLFLKRLATGDLIFFQREQRIWPELWRHMKVTIALNLVVFWLIYLIAIPIGIQSSTSPNSTINRVTTVVLFMLYSLPSFWAAELLRSLFGNKESWIHFPTMGLHSLDAETYDSWRWFKDMAWHCVLPIVCMTYGSFAYISRQMRAGMLEVIRQDYIRTAEAKGAGEWRVVLVHALRNSLFPIITLFASLLPFLIGGSVIIESIFNIPGMGLLAINSVYSREYDVIMATLIITSVLTLTGILIADILYVLVNPQVTFDSRK